MVAVDAQVEVVGSDSAGGRGGIGADVLDGKVAHVDDDGFFLTDGAVYRAGIVVDEAGEIDLAGACVDGEGGTAGGNDGHREEGQGELFHFLLQKN
ncbi:hypothetical protein D9M71_830730 [compost metagenome]